jgi:hypothetical protein
MKIISLLFAGRLFAANIATAAQNIRLQIGMASNIAISGVEWEKITPWGKFQNDKGLQDVSPETGRALVAAFNAQAAKEGANFLGIPIYVGHPDVDPKVYTDHRRYGKLTALAVRPDGLYGKPAWNDLGEQNQEQGYFVYPSPVWYFKNIGGGIIVPEELASIGLTNTPNIPGSSPWAKNEAETDTKSTALAAAVRKSLRKRRAPLLADIDAAKARQAGYAGASQIAIEAKRLMEAGESHEIAYAKARAAFPAAATAHDVAVKEHRKKLEENDRDNQIARAAHLLMEKDPALNYVEATRRAKAQISNKT